MRNALGLFFISFFLYACQPEVGYLFIFNNTQTTDSLIIEIELPEGFEGNTKSFSYTWFLKTITIDELKNIKGDDFGKYQLNEQADIFSKMKPANFTTADEISYTIKLPKNMALLINNTESGTLELQKIKIISTCGLLELKKSQTYRFFNEYNAGIKILDILEFSC